MVNTPDPLIELFLHLPHERPFMTREAKALGLDSRALRRLVAAELLVHPVRGLYYSSSLVDSLDLRVAALRLVVPEDCVVTDETAAWLWGAKGALAPNSHLTVPKVCVFAPPGRRLRNELTASGERMLADRDVLALGSLLVTTPLRTACDMGRLLSRDWALAAMDALGSLGQFSVAQLCVELDRFKGYRGIIQARALAPLVDPKAQSPGESVLRLRWLDAVLPRPTCQIEIPAPNGSYYLLDMGLKDRRFAAEYDGEEFHTEGEREHDKERRDWARRRLGWTIVVARRHNVFGHRRDIEGRLLAGYDEAVRLPLDPSAER
jgi:hypothetical protein